MLFISLIIYSCTQQSFDNYEVPSLSQVLYWTLEIEWGQRSAYSLVRSIDCNKCYKEDKQDDVIKRPAGSWGDTQESCFRQSGQGKPL